MLADILIAIAEKEVGVEEINGTNKGPRVNQYKSATNLPADEAWPWCAAFICWLFREGMKDGNYTFKRPTTAGAWDLIRWSLEQDDSTQTRKSPGRDIRIGDIIVFTFSHCGIATSAPNKDGKFTTIEGNTDGSGSREGGAVLRKLRNTTQVKARIRITV